VDQLRTLMQQGDDSESAFGNEPEEGVSEIAEGLVIVPWPREYLSVHFPVSPATILTGVGKDTSDALAALIAKLAEERRAHRSDVNLPREIDTVEARQLNETQKRDRQRAIRKPCTNVLLISGRRSSTSSSNSSIRRVLVHNACCAGNLFHGAVQVVVKVYLGAVRTAEPSPDHANIQGGHHGRYEKPSHCSQCRLSRRLAQDEADATTSKRQKGQKSK